MRIHCFQHVPFENPGTILDWIEENNHIISYTYFFEGTYNLPGLSTFDCLLIMGGYMNVDEEEKFTWIKEEKQMIRQAIDAGKKLIGICLGSQLIAAALQQRVYKGKEKEIGFFPVIFNEAALQHHFFNHIPKQYTVFHWHGDTFDLPDNALLIASTKTCPHEAFMIGRNILGLQFHFEMNEKMIEEMIMHDGNELSERGNCIQREEEIRNGYYQLAQNKKDLSLLLDKFLNPHDF